MILSFGESTYNKIFGKFASGGPIFRGPILNHTLNFLGEMNLVFQVRVSPWMTPVCDGFAVLIT